MKILNFKLNIRNIGKYFFVIPILLVVLLWGIKLFGGSVQAAWWPTGGSWLKRQQLNIYNSSTVTLHANTPVAVSIDTKSLFNQGKLRSDCNDIRVIYQPSDTVHTELSRYLVYPSGTTCATSTATKVYFNLQADLTASTNSTNYYLYFNNPQATAPSNSDNAFDMGSADALLVCPFNGSTTCAAGETPSTETGAIRYSQGKSALQFDGLNDKVTISSATGLGGMSQLTFGFWFYADSNWSSYDTMFVTNSGADYPYYCSFDNANHIYCNVIINSNNGIVTSDATVTANRWYHVAVTYNGSQVNLYVDGALADSTPASQTGNVGAVSTVYIGSNNTAQFYGGLLDEVVVYDRALSAGEVTGLYNKGTAPLVRDEYTKLLLHLDENGDDPRNTGKIIDDSGNGNHGTISGAKYVDGLVGIDNSSAHTGYQSSQSYGGHEGIFVEEGTTNKITNPSFDHGTFNTSWTAGGNNTVTVNTTAPYYKFGSQSAKIVNVTAADTFNISINTGNTNTHTLSAYVYDGTTGNIGGTVSATIAKLVFNGTAQTTTYTDMGGGWWRLTYSAAAGSGAQSYGVEIQAGKTVYVDGVQLEEKSQVTTYTDGTLGSNYSWSGTAHESTSSRTESNLQYLTTSNLSASEGTVSLWLKMKHDISNGDYHTWLFDTRSTGNGAADGTNGYTAFLQSNNIYFKNFGSSSASTYYASFTNYIDNWKHITLVWTGNKVNKIYVNGVDSTTGAGGSETTSTLGTNLHIGDIRAQTSNYETDGMISDFRVYSTALSSTQVTDLYQSGLMSRQETGQTITVDRFDSAKGQNPIAVYHFDEGYGTTADDSTTYLNHLTVSGATWIPASAGMTGGSHLKFDGSNDYASRSFDSDFNFGSEAFTVSGLFKHTSTVSGTDTILARQNGSVGYKVYMNSSGYLCFSVNSDSTCTTTSLADSRWHSFSAVRASTTLTVYVDGAQASQATGLTAATVNGNNTLYVGIDNDGSSNPWTGYIDELFIYPYARSADQVKVDNLGKQISDIVGSRSEDNLTEGLVGWWKMDETSWNGTANEVVDSSSNANHGTSVNGVTTAAGKYGKGGSFDGSNDYVNTTGSTIENKSQMTISAWVNFNSGMTEKYIAWKGGLLDLRVGTNDIACSIQTTSGYSVYRVTPTLVGGSWHNVSCTYDGTRKLIFLDGVQVGSDSTNTGILASGSGTLQFGAASSGTAALMLGSLDDIRIYDRALSPAEISQLYEWAPGPVAHWKMDEGAGQSTYDSSGNSNTGTLTNGPTWMNGKYGKSLKFDGNNDYVDAGTASSLTNPGSAITVDMWVYPITFSVDYTYFTTFTNTAQPFSFYTASGSDVNKLRFTGGGLTCSDTVTAIPTNQWSHIAFTYNSGTVILYLNGVSIKTCTGGASSLTSGSDSFKIGGYDYLSRFFSGQIDNVRIYNYARTQKQIVQDMIGSGQTVTAGGGQATTSSKPAAPIAYYKFDEGQGTTANNAGSGGSTLNGTLTNISSPATSTSGWTSSGKFGKGLVFDGSNDYVTMGNQSALNPTSGLTISAWVKPVSFNSGGTAPTNTIVSKYDDASTQRGYALYADSTGQLIFRTSSDCAGAGTVTLSSGHTLSTSAWTHVLATFDGSTMKVYANGKQAGTSSAQTSICASTAPFVLGTRYGGGAVQPSPYTFSGSIDDVKIYNYALSSEEVKQDYNRGSAMVLGASNSEGDVLFGDGFDRSDGALGNSWTGSTWTISSGKAKNTPNTGAEMTTNSSFETGNPPTGWTNIQGSPVTYEQSSTQVQDGTYSYHFIADGNNECFYQSPGLALNTWYMSTGYIYSTTSPATGNWYSFGQSYNGTYVYLPVNQWNKLTTISWASTDRVSICTTSITFPNEIYVDNVSVRALTQNELFSTVNVGKADVAVETEVTVESNTYNRIPTGLILRADSKTNPQNFLLVSIEGYGINNWGKIYINKYLNGVFSSTPFSGDIYSATPSTQYAAGGKLRVVLDGTKITIYYRNSLVGSATISDSAILNNTIHGMFSTYSGNTLDNFKITSLPANYSYAVPGDTTSSADPVAEWKFEEGAGQSANDTSGNNNTGTLGSSSSPATDDPAWSVGKFGKSLKFDGSNDYVDAGNGSSLSITGSLTLEAWVNRGSSAPTGGSYAVFSKGTLNTGATNATYGLYFSAANTYSFRVSKDGTAMTAVTSTSTYNDANWHHIVSVYTAVTDGTSLLDMYIDGKKAATQVATAPYPLFTNSTSATIGKMAAGWVWYGSIDDVKIYNYARTPAQIAWDYNRGGPVGWWKFDECTGAVAYDASGNGNNGTITIGATIPQSSAGTCSDGQTTSAWFNGKTGKINSSMSFDGVDDYVQTSDNNILDVTTNFTLSAWIKSSTGNGRIIDKITAGGGDGYLMDLLNSKLRICTNGCNSSTNDVSLSVWQHVLITYDGTNAKFYINGNLDKTIAQNSAPANALNLRLGTASDGTADFTGQLDDVRIYNYALTSTQVKTLYGGGAIRFGP